MHMEVVNHCEYKIEVAFCYKAESESFSCEDDQFGAAGVGAHDSSGISLPDTDGPGKIQMIGCIAPSMPFDVRFDGSSIRADCR